jgi:hypothetical protein
MPDRQALSIVRERLFDDSTSVRVTVVRSPLSPSMAGHSIFAPAAKRPSPSGGNHRDAYGAPLKPTGPRRSELDDGIGSRGTSQADEASLPPNSPERYGDGRSVADDGSPARIGVMGAHPLKHAEGGQTNSPFTARAASAVPIVNDNVDVGSPHVAPSLGGAGMRASEGEARRSGVQAAGASEYSTGQAHQFNSAGQPTSLAALPMYGGDGVNPSPTFSPMSPPCMPCIGVRRLYGLDWCARHATDPHFQDMYGAYASTGWVPPELPLALTAGPTSEANAVSYFQPPAASAADAAALALALPADGSNVPARDARAMADAVYRPDPNASLASVVAAAPSYARQQQQPSLLDDNALRSRALSVADSPSNVTQVRPAAPPARRVSSTPVEAANGNAADDTTQSRTGTATEEGETEVALPALRTWPSPDRVKRADDEEDDGPPPPPPPPSRTPVRIFKGAVTYQPPSPTKSASNISVNSDRAWERPPVQDGFASDLLSFLSEIQQSDKGLDGQQPELSKGEPKLGDDEEVDAAWVAEPSFSF